MKICHKCGAHNSDNKVFCVDCSERLGDKISQLEEEIISDGIDEKIDKLYNDQDPLYVDLFDKIIGIISAVGIALHLVVAVIGAFTKQNYGIWILGVIMFTVALIEALVPKITWSLEKMRISAWAYNTDALAPSGFYRVCRKVSTALFAAIGIIFLVVSILPFRYPPIVKYISDIADSESISSHTNDYIEANPEKWEIIINQGDYTVNTFLGKLEDRSGTGLEEHLMIAAIMEITGKDDITYTTKEDFLYQYRITQIPTIEIEYSGY